jgi:Ran GTPase-activating protein (RanGAP) involved in mRNA processing and transport
MRMESMKILCEVAVKDKTLTELDVSGKCLGAEGALVVAEYLDGNRALTRFDVSGNSLCAAGAKALATSLSSNQVLTELNLSSNWLGMEDPWSHSKSDMSGVAILADAIKGSTGALTSLGISQNYLYTEGTKLLAQALKGNQIMTALNISSNFMTFDGEKNGDVSGVAALADVIPSMGALSKLDARDNHIPPAEETLLQGTCGAKGVSLRQGFFAL